jgi:hypothetical protein
VIEKLTTDVAAYKRENQQLVENMKIELKQMPDSMSGERSH